MQDVEHLQHATVVGERPAGRLRRLCGHASERYHNADGKADAAKAGGEGAPRDGGRAGERGGTDIEHAGGVSGEGGIRLV